MATWRRILGVLRKSPEVGDPLPEMPVFLTPDRYVPCPLEATYQTAWEQFPAPLRGPLEAPTS